MAHDRPNRLRGIAGIQEAILPIGLGFAYWLVFLLTLEPGNVRLALHAGIGLNWSQEISRIVVASTLGALTTPLLLWLVDRFPIEGRRWWRQGFVHLAGCAGVSAGLIAVSCLLADRMLASEHRSLIAAFRAEFIANWLLLVFCIAGFIAIAHAVRLVRQVADHERAMAAAPDRTAYVTELPIRSRGRTTFLELDQIDWIEAQGNYLALHVGPRSHLLRESLSRLEPRLDPKKFTRIHRGAIVAVDRIRDMTSLGAGDASLRLKDGTELRLSRNFREHILSLKPSTMPV